MSRPMLFFLMTAALAGLTLEPAPRLLWNPTASAPRGWWLVRPAEALEIGDWAGLAPPPQLEELAAQRGYLPAGTPLIKRVAASEGQAVCRLGDEISVDGRLIGHALPRDRHGRPLPSWSGCLRVPRDARFFMNAAADSFDGRYFGVTPAHLVLGHATLIGGRGAP